MDRVHAVLEAGAPVTSGSPHIDAERRLVHGVLFACFIASFTIGAVVGELFGVTVMWIWLGTFTLIAAAAAGGLRAGE